MCVINPSDRYRLLRKGQHIANAYAVDGYCDDTEGSQGGDHYSADGTPGGTRPRGA